MTLSHLVAGGTQTIFLPYIVCHTGIFGLGHRHDNILYGYFPTSIVTSYDVGLFCCVKTLGPSPTAAVLANSYRQSTVGQQNGVTAEVTNDVHPSKFVGSIVLAPHLQVNC